MKCSRCNKKAEVISEKTRKKFCEDHAFDYMIKSGEEFLPRIEQPAKVKIHA